VNAGGFFFSKTKQRKYNETKIFKKIFEIWFRFFVPKQHRKTAANGNVFAQLFPPLLSCKKTKNLLTW